MKWTPLATFTKDPSDVMDIICDFGPFLKSDTINTATVTGTNITIDSNSVSGNVVTVFISGGSNCTTGTVKINIVTSNATPRTFERSFKVNIKNL